MTSSVFVLDDDIPRRFHADGRLIIPDVHCTPANAPASSNAVLRPIIDVLLKNVDLAAGGDPYVMRPTGPPTDRHTRWEFWLPVPIDLVWLRRRAILPSTLHFAVADRTGLGEISNGWNAIVSHNNALDGQWVRAGWRMGEAYVGPIPAPRVHWWQR